MFLELSLDEEEAGEGVDGAGATVSEEAAADGAGASVDDAAGVWTRWVRTGSDEVGAAVVAGGLTTIRVESVEMGLAEEIKTGAGSEVGGGMGASESDRVCPWVVVKETELELTPTAVFDVIGLAEDVSGATTVGVPVALVSVTELEVEVVDAAEVDVDVATDVEVEVKLGEVTDDEDEVVDDEVVVGSSPGTTVVVDLDVDVVCEDVDVSVDDVLETVPVVTAAIPVTILELQ